MLKFGFVDCGTLDLLMFGLLDLWSSGFGICLCVIIVDCCIVETLDCVIGGTFCLVLNWNFKLNNKSELRHTEP